MSQELPTEKEYFESVNERVYIDMSDSNGYVGELKELSRKDAEVSLTVDLKAALTKNWD